MPFNLIIMTKSVSGLKSKLLNELRHEATVSSADEYDDGKIAVIDDWLQGEVLPLRCVPVPISAAKATPA